MSNVKIPSIKQQISPGKYYNVDMRVARVLEAPLAQGTENPCRVFQHDVGPLGTIQSVGEFALISEEELVGKKVVIVCNIGPHKMGPYISNALTQGTRHPDSPPDQNQAVPIYANENAICGEQVY